MDNYENIEREWGEEKPKYFTSQQKVDEYGSPLDQLHAAWVRDVAAQRRAQYPLTPDECYPPLTDEDRRSENDDTILGSLTVRNRRSFPAPVIDPLYQYSSDHKYMMGIDPIRLDRKTIPGTRYSICVMRDDGQVMASTNTYDPDEHARNIEQLAKYYHIGPKAMAFDY